MLTRPVINDLKPFDATQNIIIEFNSIGGNQVVKNNLIIERLSDNLEVYNQIIDNFQFKHIILSNKLINGQVYKVKIRIGDTLGNWSEFSDYQILYCFSKPQLSITNIVDSKVNNQTYNFQGKYFQIENEPLQSYKYFLYNNMGNLIYASQEKFDKMLEHTFAGLQNNEKYFIELKCITSHGIEVTTDLIPFLCHYIQPPLVNAVLSLKNISDKASIEVSLNVKQILLYLESGTMQYLDNEWVDITKGTIACDNEHGFHIDSNFTIKMWLKGIKEEKTFLRLIGENGLIELKYYNNKIHVFKTVRDIIYHTVNSENLNISEKSNTFIWLQQIDDLMNIEAQLY